MFVFHEGTKLQIVFAPPLEKTSSEFAALWKEQGFLRGCFKNTAFRLDEPIPDELYREGLLLIIDRLAFDLAEEERIIESLETAFNYGEGRCFLLMGFVPLSPHSARVCKDLPEGEGTIVLPFSRSLSCEYCNVHVPPLTAKLFRTDWINHVHLYADVNSPTLSDLSRLTIEELFHFFADESPKDRCR
jgi:excinuclease UvrABC ATPase subunit